MFFMYLDIDLFSAGCSLFLRQSLLHVMVLFHTEVLNSDISKLTIFLSRSPFCLLLEILYPEITEYFSALLIVLKFHYHI